MVYEDQSRCANVANDPISHLATFRGDDVAARIPCAHMEAGRVFFFCECTRPISLPLGPAARGNLPVFLTGGRSHVTRDLLRWSASSSQAYSPGPIVCDVTKGTHTSVLAGFCSILDLHGRRLVFVPI